MRVVRIHPPQRIGQLQQVIAIRAAGAGRAGDMFGDIALGGRAQKSGVFFGGDIDQSFEFTPVVEAKRGDKTQIAVLFAYVQMIERIGALFAAA